MEVIDLKKEIRLLWKEGIIEKYPKIMSHVA